MCASMAHLTRVALGKNQYHLVKHFFLLFLGAFESSWSEYIPKILRTSDMALRIYLKEEVEIDCLFDLV